MIKITQKEKCCGCTACANICPVQAITMCSDSEGYLYPAVDLAKCIDCQLCEKVCQYLAPASIASATPPFYAAHHKDDAVRHDSRSGGLFTALTDPILAQGGHIYGAVLDERFEVAHHCAATPQERDRMRCSKYVQSDLHDTFSKIKHDLQNSQPVLFSGTSCQVAGLKNYLAASRSDTSQLYLLDILCYGVPSPGLWKEYKAYCEAHYQGKLTGYIFRNKEKYGWNSYVETIFIDGKAHDSCAYKHLFLSGYDLRPSCYSCLYKDLPRASDITIGDFWGIDDLAPDLNDNKGISLVMPQTKRGQELLHQAFAALDYRQVAAPGHQGALEHPCPRPADRDTFWQTLQEKGLAYIIDNRFISK